MPTTTFRRAATFLTLCTLLSSSVPFPVIASSGDTLPQGNIIIEQQHPKGKLMGWTLVNTGDLMIKDNVKSRTVSVPVGSYTLFIDQPQGYLTDIRIYKGSELLKTSDSPQISFSYAAGDDLKVFIHFQLAFSGQVNVVSTPKGVPFELRGPEGLIMKDVTPKSYDAMPIGLYSVRYIPEGCTETPPKSDELRDEQRIDFSVTLKCDVLQKQEEEDKASDYHITTEMNGTKVVYEDVPTTAWFATYVSSVSRRGIMSGYQNGDGTPSNSFGPDNPVTLAEVAKIVHGLAGLDELHGAAGIALNQSAGGWSAGYIASAEARDWLVFVTTDVDVNRPAMRGEVLVTLYQALDIPLPWPSGSLFGDVTRRTPYAGAIELAAHDGVVAGKMGGSGSTIPVFEPESTINRAEMAKIVTLAMDKYKLKASSSSSSR